MILTLSEIISTIKNGEFYIPVEEHPLLKRIYMESGSIQFEFYPNVPHVGFGINKNMKFEKLD
ncbi:hypothetical protein EXQ37_03375 [Clostridium botulinum]|nr:hypothetical protein [Clostridium botulinum]MBO0530408.1 hypothetical protein [Clostridium botulinum]MBO0538487.1 hypothetical protein [Clostridium botulinum]MBO0550551.1 hypothetical protein [Clostridium botulinum]MBO0555021.1 hypothetical protein [Clostridium botulinum]MBO0558887.1 hypothetical protein [Clostridium botulinum]